MRVMIKNRILTLTTSFILSMILTSFLFDRAILFVAEDSVTFCYLDIYIGFLTYLVTDVICLLVVGGMAVIAYMKRKRIIDALDAVLLGKTTVTDIKWTWAVLLIMAIAGKWIPFIGVISALAIPYISVMTMYMVIRGKSDVRSNCGISSTSSD